MVAEEAGIFIGLGVLTLLLCLSFILFDILISRKSQKYRKEITDMYVASKITSFKTLV